MAAIHVAGHPLKISKMPSAKKILPWSEVKSSNLISCLPQKFRLFLTRVNLEAKNIDFTPQTATKETNLSLL